MLRKGEHNAKLGHLIVLNLGVNQSLLHLCWLKASKIEVIFIYIHILWYDIIDYARHEYDNYFLRSCVEAYVQYAYSRTTVIICV